VEDIQRGLEDLMGRVRVVLEELVVLAHPESCPV
jgi:hypothetical protein